MIRLRLFGTLELRTDSGLELHSVLAHSKRTALLAFLALGNGNLHRRERLARLFWPDLDEARARNALSKALHHLRRALGDDLFAVSGAETIGLDETALWCDARAFESALANGEHAAALARFRQGELLEGFTLADSAEFDDWLGAQRVRLRRLAAQAAEALATQVERAGDLAGAAEWAALACEISSCDELALRRLLLRLSRAGNRAGALRAYRTFVSHIARELDAEPSRETLALVASLQLEGAPLPAPAPRAESNAIPPLAAAVPAGSAGPSIEEPKPDAITSPGLSPTTLPPSRPRKMRWVPATMAAFAAVIGISAVLAHRRASSGMVGIVQVRNLTGDSAFGTLAAVATGGLVQQLAQSSQAGVIDLRNSTPPFAPLFGGAAREADDRAVARSLGAGTLVRGNMYSRGDSLLLQMQIVRTSDGRVLTQLDPIVAPAGNGYMMLDRLRDRVGGAVAALADTMYQPWSTAHSRPPGYAAFQEFMQGLDAIVHGKGVQLAVDHLTRAIVLDSEFVEAKIWLLEQADMIPGDRAFVDSVSAAALAQRDRLGPFDQAALDRELAFLSGRWEDAYASSQRLVAIAPRTQDAQVYLAQAAMATRRYAEASAVLHEIERSKGWLTDLSELWQWDFRAHRLTGTSATGVQEWRHLRQRSPGDYGLCSAGVQLLASLGREAEVNALIDECATLSNAPTQMDRAHLVAGRVYRRAGNTAAAQRSFKRALAARLAMSGPEVRRRRLVGLIRCELEDWATAYADLRASVDTSNDMDRITLAVVAAHVGDTATVGSTLRWVDAWPARERPRGQDALARAFIELALGNHDRAISSLQRALEEGAPPAWNGWYVRFELQALRGDPRFEELLRPRATS